ncbi:HNH endonuclease domain-containing protein [Candidatus Haliotispira prima]|uniref:CRISPR-associated endonuclease Cas9 n=1 Tax=Candidatus Haliotispira prima TaxID=3034016 RepID=A0ABY8MJ82_9SPIO|nr:type II CRISPR RNA-guided endonuclease Cas9 [Candidatus Haliotispira prima]WGK70079.1 HNH endonuclease domain-containing protein [Candidatus Haliotispira prima]
MKTLALDLGITSIGWAISKPKPQSAGDILHCGVRIFSPGMEKKKSGYQSKTAERQKYRAARRLYNRRLRRKMGLLRVLIKENMCPLPEAEYSQWKDKVRGKVCLFPENEDFIVWLRMDPYELRYRATQEQLSAEELGRVLYHMAQRRGFKSNRKDIEKQEGKDTEIHRELQERLDECGAKSLGAYQYLQLEDNKSVRYRHSDNHGVKSSRLSYEKEFDLLMERHGIPKVEAKDLGKKLEREIFLQRPLKSQKHTVGKCVLYPRKTRAPVSTVEYEEFMMYQVLNNIKIKTEDSRVLRDEEKAEVMPLFLRSGKATFPAGEIAKKLSKFHKKKDLQINYRDKQSLATCRTLGIFTKIWGPDWRKAMTEAYQNPENPGKSKTADELADDVWHVLFSFDHEDKLREWGVKRFGLSGEALTIFTESTLKEGYGNLSLYALRRINPYLKRGYAYHDAVTLANLAGVFRAAGKEPLWQEQKEGIETTFLACLEVWQGERAELKKENDAIQKKREDEYLAGQDEEKRREPPVYQQEFKKMPSQRSRLAEFLREKYQIEEKHTDLLWHHSAIDSFPKVKGAAQKLCSPRTGAIRNPLAMHALHELRYLLNEMIADGLVEKDTEVIVELANEMNNNNERLALEQWQRERKKERDNARERIAEYLKAEGSHREPAEDEILRYILWEEQEHLCFYTGKKIGLGDALSGNNTDIEHTFPLSRTYDNSRANKTLCKSDFNRKIKKGDCPKELCEKGQLKVEELEMRLVPWLEKIQRLENTKESAIRSGKQASTKAAKDSAIQKRHRTQQDLKYWKQKYYSFFKDIPTGFINRNLVDTRIISKYAKEYLKSYFQKVYTARGAQVSEFRKEVLQVEASAEALEADGQTEAGAKDRSHHSHHMVDALTLCFLEPFLSQKQGAAQELAYFYQVVQRRHFAPDAEKRQIKESLKQYSQRLLGWHDAESLPQYIKKLREKILISHSPPKDALKQGKYKVRKGNQLQYAQGTDSPLYIVGNGVRGQLHNDTVYGAIYPSPGEERARREPGLCYVKRHDIVDVLDGLKKAKDTEKELSKVVDTAIREALRGLVEDEGRLKQSIEAREFRFIGGNGQPICVRKLRCFENVKPVSLKKHDAIGRSAKRERQPYKQHKYIVPGNNHHAQIFIDAQGKVDDKVIQLREVAERYRKGDPIYSPPKEGESLLCTLEKGRLFLIGWQGDDNWEAWSPKEQAEKLGSHLYRLAELSANNHCFVRHNIAGSFGTIANKETNFSVEQGRSPAALSCRSLARLLQWRICEVAISPTGKLRRPRYGRGESL